MTPQTLAALHAKAFAPARAWAAQEFADLLSNPHMTLLTTEHSFLLARIIAAEAEILTLATDPIARRQGHAHRLLIELQSRPDVREIILEVASDNPAARALYRAAGFVEEARRPAYYARAGEAADAVLMRWTENMRRIG